MGSVNHCKYQETPIPTSNHFQVILAVLLSGVACCLFDGRRITPLLKLQQNQSTSRKSTDNIEKTKNHKNQTKTLQASLRTE